MKRAEEQRSRGEKGNRGEPPLPLCPSAPFHRIAVSGVLIGVLCCLPLGAADLTTGYSFSSGEQNVTHTKLNNAVNNATISTGFYTDKSASSTPADADLLLLYQNSSTLFRKITVANFLSGNRGVITNQTEDTAPAIGDFILTYDVSVDSLKKATLNNAVYESAHLIANRTNWNTPGGDNFYLGYNGAWNKTARSNLWYQFWFYHTSMFTNLAAHTAPTNADSLVLWDSVSGTNRQLPLINLYSNATWATSIASTDAFPAVVAGVVSTVPVSALSNYVRTVVSNYVVSSAVKFTSGDSNLVDGAVIDVAHGLGGQPDLARALLICTNADNGYAVGDALDPLSINGANDAPPFAWGANTTNVFLYCSSTSSWTVADKTTPSAAVSLTAVNWVARMVALKY